MAASAERLARNQALFREVNDRINELVKAPTVGVYEFICECTNPSCTESLAVAVREYEAVRSHPRHFLVARDHELPEVERVVQDNGRFLTVETTAQTELSAESEPRWPSEGT
jgi:hypothetical protein